MIQDRDLILTKVRNLKQAFDNDLIPKLHQHEVNPGLSKESRENYLYFTLPVSINFQRSSPAMWQSALATYEDPETNYLFFPELVTKQPFEKVQADLIKHKLGLQKNKHTQIWLAIANTLNQYYDNDPRNVIAEGNNDVIELVKNIREVYKKRFPYLSGAKMSNYWLYILHHFTDIQLQNLNYLSIIPDTHVLQSSVALGLASELGTPDAVAALWFELLEGSELSPIDLHPILWNWSRAGFNPAV